MVISLGVMNTAITSACSNLAEGDQLGGLFGVLESVESVAGIVGPSLGALGVRRPLRRARRRRLVLLPRLPDHRRLLQARGERRREGEGKQSLESASLSSFRSRAARETSRLGQQPRCAKLAFCMEGSDLRASRRSSFIADAMHKMSFTSNMTKAFSRMGRKLSYAQYAPELSALEVAALANATAANEGVQNARLLWERHRLIDPRAVAKHRWDLLMFVFVFYNCG